MEPQITSPVLKYVSPAWPGRVAGISIFLGSLLILVLFPNVPWFVPAITFLMMIIAFLFSAETTMIADKTSKTLTVSKKRILGSSNIVYPFDDIAFICQNITTSANQKGENTESIRYTLGLRSHTGTLPGYYRGYQPIQLPIPTSAFTMFSSTIRNVQELARVRELTNFVGVPFFVNGGPNDTLVNTVEVTPGYIKEIQNLSANLPEILAQAKIENEKAAREILGDKYPN